LVINLVSYVILGNKSRSCDIDPFGPKNQINFPHYPLFPHSLLYLLKKDIIDGHRNIIAHAISETLAHIVADKLAEADI
jgi:hypothetical protein